MSFLFGSKGSAPQPFRSPGWEDQGQLLNSLLMGNVLGSNPGYLDTQRGLVGSLQGELQSLPDARQYYSGDEFYTRQNDLNSQLRRAQDILRLGENSSSNMPQLPQEATLNFGTQRDPFQFSTNYNTNVGDIFGPQLEMATRALQRQGEQQRLGISEDLNRRGLYNTGALTKALADQRESEMSALQNVASQGAVQQAQAQLGVNQFASQMDFNRQLQQAAEIFRQQGASDQQAMQLAQNALQRFGINTGLQRQPIEDLMRLYAFSTGASPGSPGSPGLLQSVLPAVGLGLATGGLGSLFGGGGMPSVLAGAW